MYAQLTPQNTFLFPPGQHVHQRPTGVTVMAGEVVFLSLSLCSLAQHPLQPTLVISDAFLRKFNQKELCDFVLERSAALEPRGGVPELRTLTGALPSWRHGPPTLSRGRVGERLAASGAPQHPRAAVCGAGALQPSSPPALRAPPAGCCAGAPPYPASPSPPAPASRKLPVNSTAFFGRESCRFAASPKRGVDETERYKYARLTVLTTRRRQEQRTVARHR